MKRRKIHLKRAKGIKPGYYDDEKGLVWKSPYTLCGLPPRIRGDRYFVTETVRIVTCERCFGNFLK